MYVEKLTLYQFRNLADQQVQLVPGVNLIHGRNGQGKTNLLEAIAFLSLSKSFRTSASAELVRWGGDAASVFCEVQTQPGQVSLGIALEPGGKKVYLNGNLLTSLTDYLGRLVTVTFSPKDLSLIKGAPQERRRFVDMHMVDVNPRLLPELAAYQRAVKSKNRLLKEGNAEADDLDPWDQILSAHGARITSERLAFIADLDARARAIYRRFSEEDGPLEVVLKTKAPQEQQCHRESLLALYRNNRKREMRYGSALYGPHLDELVVTLNSRDAKSFASQGQTRSIVLALKLAVIELLEQRHGDSPVVLLDDVDSELDEERAKSLFDVLFRARRQVIMTGTDTRAINVAPVDNESAVMRIEGGIIHRE